MHPFSKKVKPLLKKKLKKYFGGEIRKECDAEFALILFFFEISW